MDKNLFKFVNFLLTEQIALAAMFYFEQVFLFYMLIKKVVWEWFLLLIYKEPILPRSTNLFRRNHPTLHF